MNTVSRPNHYTQQTHECIEFTKHLNFPLGNAFKYIWRHQDKASARQDLQKADWYISFQIEDMTQCLKFTGFAWDNLINKFSELTFPQPQSNLLQSILQYARTGDHNPHALKDIRISILSLMNDLPPKANNVMPGKNKGHILKSPPPKPCP